MRQRLVGLIVVGTAAAGALAILAVVSGAASAYAPHPRTAALIGRLRTAYDLQAPGHGTIVLAVTLALLFAVGVGFLEKRSATRSRRSDDRVRRPLAPRLVMADTRRVYAGPVTITVLIPAHDEAHGIGATLRSLSQQEPAPDRVIVVADNCTDDTVAVSLAAGAEVYETRGNTRKKAGALNQTLADLLPAQGDNDLVMVMDADTQVDPGFLAGVVRRMTADRALMAIGALFRGEEGHGLLGQFQRNEYARHSRDLNRRRGRVFVLTGTATVFRPRALRCVAQERGRSIPGVPGDVYDTLVLTEDNEITLALKSLGGLVISPAECTVVTELMPTWGTLWAQRLRWQRGALENLGAYGLHGPTFRYWAQQIGIAYGIVALGGYLGMMLVTAFAAGSWVWFPFWIAAGLLFTAERVVSVWRGGWRGRLVAVLLLPELLYAAYLDLVYLKGVADITGGRTAAWGRESMQVLAEEAA
ncbi:glycosyltransferase family 2 protein [Nocardioides montaniterrae]